jgi:hypothetical protein
MLLLEYTTELDKLLNSSDNLDNLDNIQEAEDLLKVMHREHGVKHMDIVASYKKKIDNYKLKALFGSTGIDTNTISNNSGRKQSVLSRDNYSSRTDMLANSINQLLETEVVARNTLENLDKQTDTIVRATNRTKDINSDLSISNKLANKMRSIFR